MSHSFFIESRAAQDAAREQVNLFVKRYGGIKIQDRGGESVKPDNVSLYEVPPGVVIVARLLEPSESMPNRQMDAADYVLRYDILGGEYSQDGRSRKKALESALSKILTSL